MAVTLGLVVALLSSLGQWLGADETLTAYSDPDILWQLDELDGSPFPATATLQTQPGGRISGQAPCNSYSGEVTVPYPWFALGPVAATKMACPDLAAESLFFDALSSMTLAEVSGPVLLLSNDVGRIMVFRAGIAKPQ